MVKINLLQGLDLSEANTYKNKMKAELNGPNREQWLKLYRKAFKQFDRPTPSRAMLANIAGSGWEDTQGRGYDDTLRFAIGRDGRIGIGVELGLTAVPHRKIWLKDYVIGELRKEKEKVSK